MREIKTWIKFGPGAVVVVAVGAAVVVPPNKPRMPAMMGESEPLVVVSNNPKIRSLGTMWLQATKSSKTTARRIAAFMVVWLVTGETGDKTVQVCFDR